MPGQMDLFASRLRHHPGNVTQRNACPGKDFDRVPRKPDHLRNRIQCKENIALLPAGQYPGHTEPDQAVQSAFPIRNHVNCPVKYAGFPIRQLGETDGFTGLLLKPITLEKLRSIFA